MFKQVFAMIRGSAHEGVEQALDAGALTILRQQIRDCAAAIVAARKAVAVAMAQNEQEMRQHAELASRIDDLEGRTVAALQQGKDALAREAAETIAILQAERDASACALARFASEIDRLKIIMRTSQARLRDLERGQRMAAATQQTQHLREAAPYSGLSTLDDAEATLSGLRQRQQQIDATAAAMDQLAHNGDPAAIAEKLAEAGCGTPMRSSVDDILARLAKRAEPADQAKLLGGRDIAPNSNA